MQTAVEFFLAVGLLLVIHPMNCLRKIYRSSPASPLLLSVMSNTFIAAVVLNAFEFLENRGTEATGRQLESHIYESVDLQALEIAYNLGESLSIWIFSLDDLFLAVAFGISAYLALRYTVFSQTFGVVAACCSLLSVAGFALEVAQVLNSSVFVAFGVVTFLLTGVFMPIWIVWMAWVIGKDEWKLESVRPERPANIEQVDSSENSAAPLDDGEIDVPPTL